MNTGNHRAQIHALLRAHCRELQQSLTPEELEKLKAIPEDDLLVATHFGLATFVRNRWLLVEDSPLMAAFDADESYAEPDGVSAVLVCLLWRQLHGREATESELDELLRRRCFYP